MAQGKMKVKKALPAASAKNKKKGAAVTRRNNAPVRSKNTVKQKKDKLKQAVTRQVNAAAESTLRARALPSAPALTPAQKKVAQHHQKEANVAQ